MPSYQNQTNQHSNNTSSSSSSQEVDELQELYGNSAVQAMYTEDAKDKPNLRSPYDQVYIKHVLNSNSLDIGLTEAQLRDMQQFIRNWENNKSRYENVSRRTNMPAKLIAAIHWRESTGNFNTYLHQGDRLGQPAVNWPNNIPVFHVWEDAAVHALNMKKGLQTQLEMTADTTDVPSIATYAEAYNGLGYHYKDRPSPYVYSGSNQYSSGKYVSDGRFDASVKDRQNGVVPLMGAINGLDTEQDLTPKLEDKNFAWGQVTRGARFLRQGDEDLAVTALQEKLNELGYANSPDGIFGAGTKALIQQFQRENDLTADGVVGPGTASKLEEALRNGSNRTTPYAL